MAVDMRSNSTEELLKLEARLLDLVRDAANEENKRWDSDKITVEINLIGDRPAGIIAQDSPIIQATRRAVTAVTRAPSVSFAGSSTDSNVAMSLGVPAVTLGGGGEGGNWHSLNEWYKPTDAYLGPQNVLLTMLVLSGLEDVTQPVPRRASRDDDEPLLVVLLLALLSCAARAEFNVVEASIMDMQRAMANGGVTSRELVQRYLTRIALYDKKLNAVMTVNPNALREAEERDRERAQGRLRGPLHGIPIALKDNIHTTDMPTTGGALAFEGFVPPYEATVMKSLRDAGAVIIAKTGMTELANWMAGPTPSMPSGYNPISGFGMNPYDPRRAPDAVAGLLPPAGARVKASNLMGTAPRGAGYPMSVAATFDLAITEAIAQCSAAEALMAYLAQCAPERIPLMLVEGAVKEQAEHLTALSALTEVSLVKHDPFDDGTAAVTVHRLVQAVARERAGEKNSACSATVRLISRLAALYPDEGDHLRSWPLCAQLTPHVMAQRAEDMSALPNGPILLSRAAGYFWDRGSLKDARLLVRKALSNGYWPCQ